MSPMPRLNPLADLSHAERAALHRAAARRAHELRNAAFDALWNALVRRLRAPRPRRALGEV